MARSDAEEKATWEQVVVFDPELIKEKMDYVKVRHRSDWKLEDWSEHNYAEKFPALRARDVAFLEKIDKQHVRGVSSRGAGLAPELEAFAALIADSSGSGGSKKAASSSNGSGGEETKASAASASSSSAPELKKADGSVESVVYGIDRYKASELSVEKFKDEYERFSKPVMISSGCVDNWPSKDWTVASMATGPYKDCALRCGDDDNGRALRVQIKHYMQYVLTNKDDSPLYMFEDSFDEIPVAEKMLQDYEVPEYFRQDMFPLLPPDRRPPFRWLIAGPQRSGTRMHLDPLQTSAWNVLLSGQKRWCLLNPDTPIDIAKGTVVMTEEEKRGKTVQAIHWFSEVLPRLRVYLADLKKRTGKDYGLCEFIQYPGEVVFVPSGVWHVVVNDYDSIALTQNWVSKYNFPFVWRDLRTKRAHLAARLLQRLRAFYPDIAAVADAVDKKDRYEWALRPKQTYSRRERARAEKRLRKGLAEGGEAAAEAQAAFDKRVAALVRRKQEQRKTAIQQAVGVRPAWAALAKRLREKDAQAAAAGGASSSSSSSSLSASAAEEGEEGKAFAEFERAVAVLCEGNSDSSSDSSSSEDSSDSDSDSDSESDSAEKKKPAAAGAGGMMSK